MGIRFAVLMPLSLHVLFLLLLFDSSLNALIVQIGISGITLIYGFALLNSRRRAVSATFAVTTIISALFYLLGSVLESPLCYVFFILPTILTSSIGTIEILTDANRLPYDSFDDLEFDVNGEGSIPHPG